MNAIAALPELALALDGSALPAAAAVVAAARRTGADAVLVRPSPGTASVVAALEPAIAVMAVLPDMSQLLRDVAERGALAAAFTRLRHGGLAGAVRLARTGLGRMAGLVRQDFVALAPVLIELDRAGIGASRLDTVVLAAPLTDLLLAARHRACFAHVVRFVRDRVAPRVGFETLNLGHLLPQLDAWGIEPDVVIGPVNASGFRMKPSPAATLDAVARSRVRVLASEVTGGGAVSLAHGIAFARAHGAAGAVVLPAELADAHGPDQ